MLRSGSSLSRNRSASANRDNHRDRENANTIQNLEHAGLLYQRGESTLRLLVTLSITALPLRYYPAARNIALVTAIYYNSTITLALPMSNHWRSILIYISCQRLS